MIWEVVLIWVQLICAFLSYIVLLLTLGRLRKTKILRESPDMGYIFLRCQAKQILTGRNTEKETSRLDKLRDSVSELICAELDLPFLTEEADLEQLEKQESETKEMISNVWKELLEKIPHGMDRRKDHLLKALLFEIDSGLIKRPSDVLGRRRAHRLKTLLLNHIKDHDNKKTKEISFSQKCMNIVRRLKKALRKIHGLEKALRGISSLRLFCSTVVFTLVVLFYDIKTDYDVINKFKVITHEGPVNISLTYWHFYSAIFDGSSGYNLKRITDLPDTANSSEFRDITLINTFVRIYFSSYLMCGILLISSVLLIPTFPTLIFLSNVERKMKSSETERKNHLDPSEVLHRYNLSRAESGVESTLEMVFQVSSYLAISWELTWIATDQTDQADLVFPGATIAKSLFMSVFAISLAQYKTRMVLHGFSTTIYKKITYLLASFLNTVFGSFIWICLGMSIMDTITFGGFEVSSGAGDIINEDGRKGSKTIYYGIIMAYFFIIIILLFSKHLRLPSSSISPDQISVNSEEFQVCLLKHLCFLALLLTWNSMLSLFLFRFSRDILTPALVRQGSTFMNPITTTENEYFTPSQLGRSYTQFDRQNFILALPILMPSCFVLSYTLLHSYFKDNYDSLRFERNTKQKIKRWGFGKLNFCQLKSFLIPLQSCVGYHQPAEEGHWVDLADFNHQKEDGELDKKNPFTTVEKGIEPAVLESVLNSLPAWKKSLAFSVTHGVTRSSALVIQQIAGNRNAFIS